MNQYDTMTITEEQATRYKFPAKAVGYWAVVEETKEQMVLHRLTKNGQLGTNETLLNCNNLRDFCQADWQFLTTPQI